ncbi:MAG: rod shape-determining protein MreD [Syntrophus sp. (in: bacteria)]|nr:rod shape-determining protein MreD [Syntrophus sp. (in: bacteria)]
MRWFLFSLILLAAAILDAGNLLNLVALGSWHTRPSILVTVLVFVSLSTRQNDAIGGAFATGLAADIVGWLIGPHLICYGIFGMLLNSMGRVLDIRRPWYQAITVFFAYLLTEMPAGWLDAWKTGQAHPDLFWKVFSTALYSAIVAPLLWWILSQFWGKMGRNEPRSRIR